MYRFCTSNANCGRGVVHACADVDFTVDLSKSIFLDNLGVYQIKYVRILQIKCKLWQQYFHIYVMNRVHGQFTKS